MNKKLEYKWHGCFECKMWKFHKRVSRKYKTIVNDRMGYCTILHKYTHIYDMCPYSDELNHLKYELNLMKDEQ